MAIDVQRARRETPGCENVLHFNNAGAALMPQPVLHATIGHLQWKRWSAAMRRRHRHTSRGNMCTMPRPRSGMSSR